MGTSSLEVFFVATMVVVVIASNYFIQSSQAQTTSHVVGGTSLNWAIPPGGAAAYTTWAATQTFAVEDVLVFNYATRAHDVAEVTEAAFGTCNSTSPISISMTGPTNITLNSTGEHFFICTIGEHCSLGQKLAINVSATATTSPAPSSTTASPPPPGTSAPLVAASALPVTLLSIVVALLLI